jgi:hypothetical protein
MKLFTNLLIIDALFISLIINSGFFFQLGNFQLEYEEFFVLLAVLLYPFGMSRISYKILILSVFLIGTILIGHFMILLISEDIFLKPIGTSLESFYLNPWALEVRLEFGYNNFIRLFRVVFFCVVLTIIKSILSNNNQKRFIENLFVAIVLIQSLIGLVDLFSQISMGVSVIDSIAVFIFGKDQTSLLFRGGSYSIKGFMFEPNHFVFAFIPGMTLLGFKKESSKQTIVIEMLAVLVLFLSTSLMGFLIVFYWLGLKLLNSNKRSKYLFAAAIFIGLALFNKFQNIPLANYYFERLTLALSGVKHIGSEGFRLMDINDNLRLFSEKPLFGVGLGSTSALGLIPSILSNVGLFGLLSWLAIIKNTLFSAKIPLFAFCLISLLLFFAGDIGWFYNSVGVSVLLGISIAVSMNPNDYLREEIL